MSPTTRFLAAILLLSASAAHAFSIQDEEADAGQTLTVENEAVDLVHVGSDAGYTNSVAWDAFSPRAKYSCTTAEAGWRVSLGSFGEARELEFFLRNSLDEAYISGPGQDNMDGVAHARLLQTGLETVLVEWEDTLTGGDLDYNDCVFELLITPLR